MYGKKSCKERQAKSRVKSKFQEKSSKTESQKIQGRAKEIQGKSVAKIKASNACRRHWCPQREDKPPCRNGFFSFRKTLAS